MVEPRGRRVKGGEEVLEKSSAMSYVSMTIGTKARPKTAQKSDLRTASVA